MSSARSCATCAWSETNWRESVFMCHWSPQTAGPFAARHWCAQHSLDPKKAAAQPDAGDGPLRVRGEKTT